MFMETIENKKVKCNKKGKWERYPDCIHGKSHYPIGDCDKKNIKCSPNIDDTLNLVIETQCAK